MIGLGWVGDQYDAALVKLDERGAHEAFRLVVPAADLMNLRRQIFEWQKICIEELPVAIDSSSGIIEHFLVSSSIALYRVDPQPGLSRRPGGSADPIDIAQAWTPLTSHRLSISSGGLIGREEELMQHREEAENSGTVSSGKARVSKSGVSTNRSQVALTFDDGPGEESTMAILDILRHFDVPATFFCLGLAVSANKSILETIADAGHTLGNHTWSHPYLPDLTDVEIADQVDSTGMIVEQILGYRPTFFRPPYGIQNSRVSKLIRSIGIDSVLWDVDSRDWAAPGVSSIVKNVLDQVHSGSIILMHDGGTNKHQTVGALPAVIEGLVARGLEIVSIATLR